MFLDMGGKLEGWRLLCAEGEVRLASRRRKRDINSGTIHVPVSMIDKILREKYILYVPIDTT
jgi:hypothetical protein